MKLIFQDKFYDQDKGTRGNCMQAAVASLFELELNQVPNFIEAAGDFWEAFHQFFRDRGFIAQEFHQHLHLECFYIASGMSPRGVMHSVIYQDGRLVHDPHPSGAGITDVMHIYVAIPINPAALGNL